MTMKYILTILCAIGLVSCTSTKTTTASREQALYEVLTQQPNGGSNIQFYEIISEEKEINMLMNDEFLKDKISPSDVQTSNFVILNMGEKRTGGYSITVDSVREIDGKIHVKVKEIGPGPGDLVTQAFTYPYAIVKINSKKPIVFE